MNTGTFFEDYHTALFNCSKPYQYVGGEFLSCNKDFDKAKVRFALAFPDKYEIGISNLGLRVLYDRINSQRDFMADRVYAPQKDFHPEPLYALESKRPLKEFDAVGFSLQYEMAYPTVLKMLEMAGIPYRNDERTEDDPIIFAGGPCAFNPLPVSDFIDVFMIGDGEDSIVEVCEILEKTKNMPRAQRIKALVEGKTTIQHVKTNTNEIPCFKNKKTLAKWLQEEFAKQRCITIKSTGQEIFLPNASAKRDVIKHGYKETLHNSVYPKIRELLRLSVFYEFRPADEKHAGKVKGQNIYYSAIEIDNIQYRVEFKVDIPLYDKFLPIYAGHTVKIIAPASLQVTPDNRLGSPDKGAINYIITDNALDFNPAERNINNSGRWSALTGGNVTKRIAQLDYETALKSYPIPFSSSVHDRAIVEVRRGCGRMCRFCQPGHVTLPVRERSAEDIIKITKELVTNTGYDEYSLLSLSSNDYSNIKEVIRELAAEFDKKKISVSLPSQRIDGFDTELANLVQSVRKSTVTLAPEAGSRRLRNVIKKNISEDQILDAVTALYENGRSRIKLYFICGLPTETLEDMDEMAELLGKIKKTAPKLQITCTLSIFVPKPFTPFQWHGQMSLEKVTGHINYLKDKTRHIKGLKINYHDKFTSQIEAVLTRGDASLNRYIEALYKKGCYLDAWSEHFDKNIWHETAQELGIDLAGLAEKNYPLNEPLSWDFIDVGIDKEWFIKEYKADIKDFTPTCHTECVNCGVCRNLKTKKTMADKYSHDKTVSFTQQDVDNYKIKGSIKAKYRQDFQGKTIIRPDIGNILLTRKGLEETIAKNKSKNLFLLSKIDELILNGEYYGFEKLYKERKDYIAGFHVLYAKYRYSGQYKYARIKIAADKKQNRYWLLNSVNNNERGFTACPDSISTTQGGAETSDSIITDAGTNFNPAERNVYRYRIKLTKTGILRYFSHLDWQNTFFKAVGRTDLNVAFSQGFNPGMKISMGIALPLFARSECELADIEIYDSISPENLKLKLEKVLPYQAKIIDVKQIDKSAPAIDHTAVWAEYKVKIFNNKNIYPLYDFKDLVYNTNKVLSSEEIFIEKKNKKGLIQKINIKPSVKSYRFEGGCFSQASSGSGDNVDECLFIVLKTGQKTDIPALRADVLMNAAAPGVIFDITRTKFFDEKLVEL